MTKRRLDQRLTELGLARSRSQAESYIRLGYVQVNGLEVTKPGYLVDETAQLSTQAGARKQYVSRAALKLSSAVETLEIEFEDKTVLDVGSSTGGFTDYSLRHGAAKVIAVEVGSNQLHPTLRGDVRIELHEKTDIRQFKTSTRIDLVLIDVSFISLREILPAIWPLVDKATLILVMVKPQFEAAQSSLKHKGVIKNDKVRRQILKNFETWVQTDFIIVAKVDSSITGTKGNLERFYLLKKA